MNLKFKLLILTTASFYYCQAQVEWGLNVKGGTSIIKVSGTNNPKTFEEKLGIASNAGLTAKYYFSEKKKLHINSGLNFAFILSKFDHKELDLSFISNNQLEARDPYTENANIFVSIPVTIGYTINKISVATGLETFYNAYQHNRFGWEEYVGDYTRKVKDQTNRDASNKNNILLSSLTKVEYRVWDNLSLELDVNIGLTDYFKLNSPSLNPNYKSRIHSTILGIRYYL